MALAIAISSKHVVGDECFDVAAIKGSTAVLEERIELGVALDFGRDLAGWGKFDVAVVEGCGGDHSQETMKYPVFCCETRLIAIVGRYSL